MEASRNLEQDGNVNTTTQENDVLFTNIDASDNTDVDVNTDPEVDLPLALRRPKRRCSMAVSPVKPRAVSDSNVASSTTATVTTPSKRRSKRVRFSDPALLSSTPKASSSLTPAFRRASLGTPRSHRRHTPGTPASRSQFPEHIQFTPYRQVLDERVQRRLRRNGLSDELNKHEQEKKSTTNLLKEIEAKDAELKRLQDLLKQAEHRPIHDDFSHDVRSEATLPAGSEEELFTTSQQKVDELEAELEALRQSFALEETTTAPTSWNFVPLGPPGPHSDGGDTIRIHEDDDVGSVPMDQAVAGTDADALAMGLELEAARQAKQSFLGSFREANATVGIHFQDSPARTTSTAATRVLDTPKTFLHDISKQLKAVTNRAEEAEVSLASLETEVKALGFGGGDDSAAAVVAAVSRCFRDARLELERAIPGETTIAFENGKLLSELVMKLKLLSTTLVKKHSELKSARDQHHSLKKNFEKAIVAAEKANDRIKRLEANLDSQAEETLHQRMRAQGLEKSIVEKERDVASLTSALDRYRSDIVTLEQLIQKLETDHATQDVTSAEVAEYQEQKIEELEAKVTAEERGRRAAEISAVARLGKINELETALAATKRDAAEVEARLAGAEATVVEVKGQVNSDHAEEVGRLNSRISSLSTALTSAQAEVEKLKVIKGKLEERVRMEVNQGAHAVESLQEQLLRTLTKTNETKKTYVRGAKVRIANWELEEAANSSDGFEEVGPMTPASLVRFAEFAEVEDTSDGNGNVDTDADASDDHVPGSVEISRGRKRRSFSRSDSGSLGGLGIVTRGILASGKPRRRRYDSGIGMSPVEEGDARVDTDGDNDRRPSACPNAGSMNSIGSGVMTPDLSSDTDTDFGTDAGMDVDMTADADLQT